MKQHTPSPALTQRKPRMRPFMPAGNRAQEVLSDQEVYVRRKARGMSLQFPRTRVIRVDPQLLQAIDERMVSLTQQFASPELSVKSVKRIVTRVKEAQAEHLTSMQNKFELLSQQYDLIVNLLQNQPSPVAITESRNARAEQGETLRATWVKDRLLVNSSELSNAWSRTRQALDQACTRGELFAVKIGKNKYYPVDFLTLEADAVKQVNLALKGNDSVAKFIFWSRKHGALGNKTIAEALKERDSKRLARAIELATGWSEERGFVVDAPDA